MNKDTIKFYIFSTTLGASRFHTFIYSKFMTLESVERCLIETFQIIGGIPKECLTDNMSSIINYSQHDFTPDFKTFSKDMGFTPKHCKVLSPQTKGKDESCNRFMNWLQPYNYEFENESELIEIIKKLNKEINKEVNQTTNMPPVVLFDNKLYVYYNKNLIKIHDISNKKINYDSVDYTEGLSSSIYYKSQDEIDDLAKHNLELLSKITK